MNRNIKPDRSRATTVFTTGTEGRATMASLIPTPGKSSASSTTSVTSSASSLPKRYQTKYVPITTQLPGYKKKSFKEKDQAIRVVVRFRPPNEMEIEKSGGQYKSVAEYGEDEKTIVIRASYGEEYGYTFDRVFDETATQEMVYTYAAKPIVEDVMNGYNGTVFAYGQTASGKTHTMEGPNIEDPDLMGIIPRMIGSVFDYIMDAEETLEFNLKVSYVEIYMEKIRDLLDSDPQKPTLQVREDKARGIWIEGATEVYVGSMDEVMAIMKEGAANRVVAHTKMNVDSSRSHAVFIVTVTIRNLEDLSQRSGKMYLVDLAGSEKVGKTNVTGITLEEAKQINKSLSALGLVINSLTDGKSTHIPYRDSKLTRVLQESLGGNSRTTLIANASPAAYNELESLSTLRFATRAKTIKNRAKINKERSAKELTVLLERAEKEIVNLLKYTNVLEQAMNALGVSDLASVKTHKVKPEAEETIVNEEAAKLLAKVVEIEQEAREEEEEEKNRLVQQHSDLLTQVQEKEQELDEQTEAYDLIRSENEAYKEAQEALEQENSVLLTKLADSTYEFERIEFEKNESVLNAEALASANAALKSDLETAENAAAKSKAELGVAQETIKGLEEQLASLQPNSTSEVASAKMQWSARENELKKVLGKLQDIEGKLDDEETSDSGAETRHQAVQVDAEDAVDVNLRARLAGLEGSLESFRERAKTLSEENTLLDQKIREMDDKYRTIENERNDLKALLAKFEAVSPQLISPLSPAVPRERSFSFSSDADGPSGTPDRYQQLQKACLKLEKQSKLIKEKDRTLETLKSEDTRLKIELSRVNEELKIIEHERNRQRQQIVELESNYAGRLKYIEEREKEWEKFRADAASRTKLDREKQAVIEQTQSRLREFEHFRDALLRDLQNRCEKVVELEMLLDQSHEKYQSQLQDAGGKHLARKINFLEQNLEQLTTIHQQLMNQNSALQLEKEVLERKNANRNQRIKALEQLMHDANAQALKRSKAHEEETNRYRKLVTDLEHAYNAAEGAKTSPRKDHRHSHSRTKSGVHNIVKQIRGGGTAQVTGIRGGSGTAFTGAIAIRAGSSANMKPEKEDTSEPAIHSGNVETSDDEIIVLDDDPKEYAVPEKPEEKPSRGPGPRMHQLTHKGTVVGTPALLLAREREGRRNSDAGVQYMKSTRVVSKSRALPSESLFARSPAPPATTTDTPQKSIPGGDLWGTVRKRDKEAVKISDSGQSVTKHSSWDRAEGLALPRRSEDITFSRRSEDVPRTSRLIGSTGRGSTVTRWALGSMGSNSRNTEKSGGHPSVTEIFRDGSGSESSHKSFPGRISPSSLGKESGSAKKIHRNNAWVVFKGKSKDDSVEENTTSRPPRNIAAPRIVMPGRK